VKKTILSLVFLPLVISNTSHVETTIKTEATGENASVHTEITNIVNGKETRVESDQPGEIRVEVKNGEVKVESSSDIQPTITISGGSDEEVEILGEEVEVKTQAEEIRTKIVNFFEDLVSRLRRTLFFWEK
jgi:hypothetical protein